MERDRAGPKEGRALTELRRPPDTPTSWVLVMPFTDEETEARRYSNLLAQHGLWPGEDRASSICGLQMPRNCVLLQEHHQGGNAAFVRDAKDQALLQTC